MIAPGAKRDVDAPIEHLFRWDLDKTYLLTEFDKLADLVRTAMQKPEEKRTVPGARALLQALLRPAHDGSRRAVTFVSGSPRQMRKVLIRKLQLDGIEPDAFMLKPNLQNLLLLRFKALRGQVGYKLRALLEHQLTLTRVVPETLFGDDAEQDAIIYSIYAEIVAGRIGGDELERLLEAANVYSNNREAIVEATAQISPAERVRRIFIILDRKSPPARFAPYAPRLVPVYNYFQAALVLYQDRLLGAPDLVDISLDMMDQDGYNPFALTNSMQDVVRRGHLRQKILGEMASVLRGHDETGEIARKYLDEFADRISALQGYEIHDASRSSEPIDYVSLLQRELSSRKEHKRAEKAARKRRTSIFR